MIPRSRTLLLIVLAFVLMLTSIFVIRLGAVNISWSQLPHLLLGNAQQSDQPLQQLLLQVRLPRLLLSIIVGAVLAGTGVVMQALFRNPLAEPGLMGVSSGASLGAVIAIVLLSDSLPYMSVFAFVGSILATFLVYEIGKRFSEGTGLLLAGIAINAIAFSIIGILTYTANDIQLRNLTFWSMGSLANATWGMLGYLIPWCILGLVFLCLHWKALNALLLGEKELGHLGFSINSIHRHLIIGTALIVGPCVAITGGIGFVGLVIPHLLRIIIGANHKYLLPAAILGGALLLSLADTLARTVILPAELPVGLITSLLGGPFFLYLLLTQYPKRSF